jgi:hypothetical protein
MSDAFVGLLLIIRKCMVQTAKTLSVFVTLGIQHAMRMRRATPSCVAWPALYFFPPHYLINGTIFEKKILNIKFVI